MAWLYSEITSQANNPFALSRWVAAGYEIVRLSDGVYARINDTA